ncbi:hypothetical protein QKT49_gp039 [Acanthamoeba castellanii medusavirus]|uniref:Uncharacterized protein n=1 Tax=Acanthamoeba castellanii medusavirus J1 TaxID=3114988 RepID=A0A3T1CWJ2_9VIRU|nr:hypothetical protein QKT49_gp039 [Acanthamoeba castellanii medusavirus]BBI30179.1 hypothetical protein [Acanthamoeba castellanii medusavirus J1]
MDASRFECPPSTFGEKVLNSLAELYWGESLPVGRCIRRRAELLRQMEKEKRDAADNNNRP